MSEAVNKRIHLVNVIIFCAVLLLGGVALLAMKKGTISEMENRKLVGFPVYSDSALWSGDYFRKIDEYYSDNFPFRDKWISFSGSFRNIFGYESSDITIYNPANNAEANENPGDTTKK